MLSRVSLIACEDTRVARRLLQGLGLPTPVLLAAHAHNERSRAAQVLAAIAAGQACALISDAGTPAVSDPGARLVHAAHEAGVRVVPVPGASAAVALMSAAGIDADRHGAAADGWWFEGFLPSRNAARDTRLAALLAMNAPVLVYESPHRIEATLAALARLCSPARELTIGRELTKRFEQVVRLSSDEAPHWLAADDDHRRGEFVLAIAPPRLADLAAPDEAIDWQARPEFKSSLDDLLIMLAAALPPRQAARLAARLSGLPADTLYDRLLEQRARRSGTD